MSSGGCSRVLGIDPGTRMAGYGIVEIGSDGKLRAVAVGAWDLRPGKTLAERLFMLATEFRRVVLAHTPNVLCVELPFVARNSRSALVLGTARGVILAEGYARGMEIHEINATAAKRIVTGDGYADKAKVARSLAALLKVDFGQLPPDATDALAIAYAHVFRTRAAAMGGETTCSGQRRVRAGGSAAAEWSQCRKRSKKTTWESVVSARTVAKS